MEQNNNLEKKQSNKKKYLVLLGPLVLVIAIFGVTYAWFTYRAETSEQEMVAGDIYLNLNEGTGEISLTNVFPETAEEARAKNNNFITFNITGKNESNKTIYYDFILDHGSDKASPKTRYRDEDLRFDLVSLDANGDEDEYLLSAVSYETLVNRRIYVDTVDANTTSQVTRRYKLRMWLDENVIISDTAPDATYNTTEYKNKYATIKLIASGDFTEKEASRSLYTIMRKSAVMDNTTSTYVTGSNGIDFGAISSDTNGKGVYMRAGTENDAYPIMYYRGAVENNNVVFANQCWKTVRTTDTGGVKLIYNGTISANKASLSQSDYGTPVTNNGFTFDTTDNSWNATMTTNLTSSDAYEISFNVPAGDGYVLQISGVPTTVGGVTISVYKGGSQVNGTGGGSGTPFQLTHTFGTLTASDTIKVTYYMSGGNSTSENPSTIKVQMLKPDATLGMGCANSGSASQITLNVSGTDTNTFAFNSSSNSPAYVGYMYGTVYTYSNSNWTSNAKFGSSFTWDGTNYKLVDASVTTPNATHHYSCNSTDAEATCTDLRYVYYASGSTKNYVTLTGGDGIEQAMTKMQTNTNDSNAKDKIDTWYANNLTNYTNKLEDTVWCNDRSVGDNNNNGWIANGGDLSTYLTYGATQRSNLASQTSTVKNQPSLACANKNDRYTVNNGNGNQALQYPTALLTEDEIVLAGGKAGVSNGTYYLTTGNWYWSLSPSYFNDYFAFEFYVNYGYISDYNVYYSYGLRPSVSLKSSTQVISGTGTVIDPYVIE